MSFVQTQTSELPVDRKDEIEILSRAIWLIGHGQTDEAVKLMIARHDQLIKERPPVMKLYGT